MVSLATTAKSHRRGLQQRIFLSHSGGWKIEIKVWSGLVRPEVSVLGLQRPSPPRSSLADLCTQLCLYVSFHKDPVRGGQDHSTASLYFNDRCKGLASRHNRLGTELQHKTWGRRSACHSSHPLGLSTCGDLKDGDPTTALWPPGNQVHRWGHPGAGLTNTWALGVYITLWERVKKQADMGQARVPRSAKVVVV